MAVMAVVAVTCLAIGLFAGLVLADWLIGRAPEREEWD